LDNPHLTNCLCELGPKSKFEDLLTLFYYIHCSKFCVALGPSPLWKFASLMVPFFWQSNADLLFGGMTIICGILGTLAGGLFLDKISSTIPNAFKVNSVDLHLLIVWNESNDS